MSVSSPSLVSFSWLPIVNSLQNRSEKLVKINYNRSCGKDILTLILCYCRHIHTDLTLLWVTVKDNLLATSSYEVWYDDEVNVHDVVVVHVHDVSELVSPEVKTDELYSMELKCPRDDDDDDGFYDPPTICLNQTSLFAITKSSMSEGTTIHQWDFWSYD